MTKLCVICGKEFVISRRKGLNSITCSRVCSRIRDKERIRVLPTWKACTECGGLFLVAPRQGRKKVCDYACARKHRRAAEKLWRSRHPEKCKVLSKIKRAKRLLLNRERVNRYQRDYYARYSAVKLGIVSEASKKLMQLFSITGLLTTNETTTKSNIH